MSIFTATPLRRLLATTLACAATVAAHANEPADAADYPNKEVRVIVTYAPGGANDTTARLYAQELSQAFGQPFVVENRAGGSGIPGTQTAARADADGYTLLLGAGGTMTINPGMYKDLPYDPIRDFTPVGLLATAPLVLVVPPSLPVHTVPELLEYAKKQPDGITFASPGAGTPLHLAGELFTRSADLNVVHVPYKGSSPALNDLIAGRTDMMFDVLTSSIAFIKDERLRAIAVSSKKRSPQLPDLPTVAEQGMPDFDVSSWFAYFAPTGTPQPIIEKLNKEINRIAASDAMRERLASMGMEPGGGTPAELGANVAAEKARWADVIEKAGVVPNN